MIQKEKAVKMRRPSSCSANLPKKKIRGTGIELMSAYRQSMNLFRRWAEATMAQSGKPLISLTVIASPSRK